MKTSINSTNTYHSIYKSKALKNIQTTISEIKNHFELENEDLNTLIIIEARYMKLKGNKLKGLINLDEEEKILKNIQNDFLEFLDTLNSPTPLIKESPKKDNNSRKFGKNKIIQITLVILLSPILTYCIVNTTIPQFFHKNTNVVTPIVSQESLSDLFSNLVQSEVDRSQKEALKTEVINLFDTYTKVIIRGKNGLIVNKLELENFLNELKYGIHENFDINKVHNNLIEIRYK